MHVVSNTDLYAESSNLPEQKILHYTLMVICNKFSVHEEKSNYIFMCKCIGSLNHKLH